MVNDLGYEYRMPSEEDIRFIGFSELKEAVICIVTCSVITVSVLLAILQVYNISWAGNFPMLMGIIIVFITIQIVGFASYRGELLDEDYKTDKYNVLKKVGQCVIASLVVFILACIVQISRHAINGKNYE